MPKGVRAIIMKNGKILLGKRLKKDSFYGQWCTFGGLIQQGEIPLQALKRELHEELGIEIVNPELIAIFEDRIPEIKGKFKQFFYLIKHWRGHIRNKSEHLETRWFSPNELKDLPIGRIGRRAIEKLLTQVQEP